MKLFQRVLIGLAVLAVILIGAAYLLPREVTVERTIEIAAPAEAVFPHVNSMTATQAWSPWMDRDPNVQVRFEGPDSGVGNKMHWASDMRSVGTGTQEIVASVPNSRVDTALDFGPMGLAEAWFQLDETGGSTTVTWGFRSDMGLWPQDRYMGLMMDGFLGPDYEAGLANLKALVEQG